jgi:hypothetical protein
VRIIRRHKVRTGFQQVGDKGDVARQAVQFGDNELGLMPLASSLCGPELRTIAVLAALDLGELARQLPIAAVKIGFDRLALGFQAEARFPLLVRRNPVVSYEFPVNIAPP